MLRYIPPMSDGTVELVMLPTDRDFRVESDSRTKGCWRLDADSPDSARSMMPFPANPVPTTLSVNETYTLRHKVYHNIRSETCFPDKTYTTAKELQFSDDPEADPRKEPIDGPTFELEYVLTVSDSADPSITANGPT